MAGFLRDVVESDRGESENESIGSRGVVWGREEVGGFGGGRGELNRLVGGFFPYKMDLRKTLAPRVISRGSAQIILKKHWVSSSRVHSSRISFNPPSSIPISSS